MDNMFDFSTCYNFYNKWIINLSNTRIKKIAYSTI